MNAHFILLVLGAILVYGLAPAFLPALVIIGLLWIIAAAPQLGAIVAIGAAVAVILKAPIRWFFEGLFGGLGLRFSGLFQQPRPRRPGRRARLIRSARAALDDDGDDGRDPPPRKPKDKSTRALRPSTPLGNDEAVTRASLPSPSRSAELPSEDASLSAVTRSRLAHLDFKKREALAAAQSAQAALDQGAPAAALIRYALAYLSNQKVA